MIFNERKIKDITGLRSGHLVAIQPVNPPNRYGDSKRKVILWECRCDCGEMTIQRTSRIIGRTVKSCGCLSIHGRNGVARGHKRRIDSAFSGERCGNVPLVYFHSIEDGAKRRNIRFDISAEYVRDLYNLQGGRCLLSGRLLTFGIGSGRHKETTASLDRIDSSVGYIEGNLQWVHKGLNMMKKGMDNESFKAKCIEMWEIIRDVAMKV